MKTVGELIRSARVARDYSIEKLAEITHIKSSFIDAIEKGKWESLPEFNIALGFVKSISHFLDIDETQAVSLFRREYPVKLVQNSKFEVKSEKKVFKKFVWGPRMTFFVGVIIIILVVVGYLGISYRKFNSAPPLVVNSVNVNNGIVDVSGRTDSGATVVVDGQDVIVNDDGSFSAQIQVSSDTNQIRIDAKSRSGKDTVVYHKITTQ